MMQCCRDLTSMACSAAPRVKDCLYYITRTTYQMQTPTMLVMLSFMAFIAEPCVAHPAQEPQKAFNEMRPLWN
jgi:hypothetical protein